MSAAGPAESSAARLKLVGGALCLDFANTAGNHASEHPSEYLRSYRDLVAWSRHAGLLDDEEQMRLLELAEAQPDEAERVLKRAVSLREVIYRVFSQLASGRGVPERDLDCLNEALGGALRHARIVPGEGRFVWSWAEDAGALDSMLWPIAWSAATLLTCPALLRVRQCAGDECGWLFIDTSRNRSRRWCDMADCGNREKARRHYRRLRARGTATENRC